MSLNITQYVDPGVYVGEVVVPGSVSASTVPLTVCLIGIASRNKQASNEAVTRGLVSDETLTLASSSPHTASLAHLSNRKMSQTGVTKDGVLLDTSLLSFKSATVTGGVLTTLDFTTANEIALALDGKQTVTVKLAVGADSATVSGGLITQHLASITDITAVTPAEIAEGINKALANASSLGYGSAYGSVASVATNKVVLTSPATDNTSDVKLFTAFPSAADATAAVFGVSLPYTAATVLQVADSAYSNTSVFKASYVATDVASDTLLNDNVQSVARVGSFAGVTSYKLTTDFTLSGNTLVWTAATAAVFTSSIASSTFNIATNDTVILSLDGKASITVDLNGLGSPPPGYANPSSAAAATPTEIALNINAVLANSAVYGPAYRAVASVSGSGSSSKLVLTSPTTGNGSIVQVGAPSLNSAVTALFGLSSTQLPYSTFGTGSKPVPGAVYFATYLYTRPSADYNTPKRYFSPDALYSDLGQPARGNQLAIGGGLCFENQAPSVMVVQVNDATFNGAPTSTEFKAALDAAGNSSVATEIVALSTNLNTQTDLVTHVENQSSPTQQHYRRGWFGMAAGTVIGDTDTPGSFVYAASKTLQVSPDSPGRGRLVLVAPSQAVRNVTSSTGATLSLAVDGTYIAAAVASLMTSFTSPADTLLRKTITGFDTGSFPTYLKAERAMLASHGVTVVTLIGGNLVLTDPVTTEVAGGKVVTFQEISASTQKDAVTTAVTDALDNNLVGVVPTDPDSFILTIKGFLGNVLNALIATGSIAPFKSADGTTRDIDLSTDVQVFQDPTNPTQYQFRYFFNLRLPAKRFFGSYSVNNPFF
jgi:hypothetical protein